MREEHDRNEITADELRKLADDSTLKALVSDGPACIVISHRIRASLIRLADMLDRCKDARKRWFSCPTEDGEPKKGEWCGRCREICDADGTNWCPRNLYGDVVDFIETGKDDDNDGDKKDEEEKK